MKTNKSSCKIKILRIFNLFLTFCYEVILGKVRKIISEDRII